MKRRKTANYALGGFLAGVLLASPRCLMAQAAPGPLVAPPPQAQAPAPQPIPKPAPPVVPPRTTLAGAWKLNRDDSDDPQQKVRAVENASTPNSYPRRGYPGGYPGGYGYPPMGGRYPYPEDDPNSMPSGGGKGIADNPKMQPLIHPSESLSIDLKNPEVDVTDDRFRKLILFTDGRQIPKTSDDNQQVIAGHWSGSQLVSDEKSPLGGKMTRTFALSQSGRSLYETVHIDNGRSKMPLTIRYVYGAASSSALSGEDSDPDRPVLKRNPDSDNESSPQ